MKPKKILYSLCFIIAGFVFLLFIFNDRKISFSDTNTGERVSSNKLMSSDEKLVVSGSSPVAKSRLSNSSNNGWSPMEDAATAEKIKSWFAGRGNYSFYGADAYGEYQDYDNETLTTLSNDGDIRAMHVLADRAKNIPERKSILIRAAVYGSTEALSRLATIQDLDRRDHVKTAEDKKTALFEILAYLETAELRGDWWPKIQMRDYYIKQYQIELTHEDNAIIAGKAKEIYEQLSLQRRRLGLDDFDNAVPDEVMKFYEEMLKPL